MFRTRLHDEQGFSLIELLMATMVTGVILTALATGFIVTMKGTRGSHERLLESHDAQLLATYFPSDVQSADQTLSNLATWTAAGTPADCAGPPASGSDNKLLLRWTELVNGSSLRAFSVSYRMEGTKLARYYCTGTTSIATPLPTAAERTLALQAALAGVTATSDVVAHDLNPTQAAPTLALGTRKLFWSLTTSPKALEIEPGPYTFELSASMRKLGTVAAPPPAGSFVISAPASVTAGMPFTATVTLTGFSGPKTLTWSGPGSAPNGTAGPSYPANPVNFNGSGQATVSINLVNAETTTLTVSDGGTITGSVSLAVSGGVANRLGFTSCSVNGGPVGTCPANVAVGGNNKKVDARVSVFDLYGNAAGIAPGATWIATVTSNDQANFAVSSSPVTVTGMGTESTLAFRVTHMNNSSTGPATITATSVPALSSASITVSKN